MLESSVLSRIAGRLRGAPGSGRPTSDDLWATCRAPHTALRFSPTGVVRACCANDKVALGTVGEESLRDIWEGAPIRALALALDAGDYGHGCDDCAPGIVADREASPAANFDRFERQPRRGWPVRLEFALSNRCNLLCVMCNGELSSTIRAQREHREPLPMAYGDDFFEEIRPFLRHARETAFIGGEPFLEPGCRRIWDQLIDFGAPGAVHVTTNGTVGGARVEHYLRALRMEIAMSIDAATPELFESIRVGASFDRVIEHRDRFLELVRSYGRRLAVNFCLMTTNWNELHLMCLEADRIDVDLQVIPVFWPAHDSILCLPDDEVADIVAELDRLDREIRGQLERNRDAWDDALALLRGHLRRAQRDEIPVALRVRQIERPAPTDPSRARELLAEWSPWPPLELTTTAGAREVVEGLTRWIGPLQRLEPSVDDPDRTWHATFDSLAGPVSARSAPLGADPLDPSEPGARATAIAFDRDPSLLVDGEPASILDLPGPDAASSDHEERVVDLMAQLEARLGVAPIRLDLDADGRIIERAVLPSWLDRGDDDLTGRDAATTTLPATDAPVTAHELVLFAPLVVRAQIALSAAGRAIDGELYLVRRLGPTGCTAILGPAERF